MGLCQISSFFSLKELRQTATDLCTHVLVMSNFEFLFVIMILTLSFNRSRNQFSDTRAFLHKQQSFVLQILLFTIGIIPF